MRIQEIASVRILLNAKDGKQTINGCTVYTVWKDCIFARREGRKGSVH
jgi:hypothetical protein